VVGVDKEGGKRKEGRGKRSEERGKEEEKGCVSKGQGRVRSSTSAISSAPIELTTSCLFATTIRAAPLSLSSCIDSNQFQRRLSWNRITRRSKKIEIEAIELNRIEAIVDPADFTDKTGLDFHRPMKIPMPQRIGWMVKEMGAEGSSPAEGCGALCGPRVSAACLMSRRQTESPWYLPNHRRRGRVIRRGDAVNGIQS
jgi:hypothetical protein